jgi:hypothetical protein
VAAGTAKLAPVKIVCLGWGSLVWKPDVLRCKGPWQPGGPPLPLEFARTSRDGRLTLVLTEGGAACPTYWVELDYHTAEQAQEALAGREASGPDSIGVWPGPAPRHAVGADSIARWAAEAGADAVVWTALKPKFLGEFGRVPADAEEVLAYLRGLDAEATARAREYVVRACADARTPFREAIERELGWTPETGG